MKILTPRVRQMVREAIENSGDQIDKSEIEIYIDKKWPGTNATTIDCQIRFLTVNSPSRINWSDNKTPRLTNQGNCYDFCFKDENKKIVRYDPEKHGIWEIYETPEGKLGIKGSTPDTEDNSETIWQLFSEGASSQVIQTRYERSLGAREVCIEHYGYSCAVCDFNFEERYGDRGKDFIHIHHLTPVANIKSNYRVDPIKDLRPVCPNCHAMLHRKASQLLSIEDLKLLLR